MAFDPGKRTTLRDVARAAGVSHMTVVRTIAGSPLVAAATADRVKQFVERLGYRPDPSLSALAAYRSKRGGHPSGNVLGFIDCDGTEYSGRVLEGARGEAELLGYAVENFPLPSAVASQRQLGRSLFHRGIRGLMFGPSDKPLDLGGWDWSHFATVSLGAVAHEPMMHAVAMDYFYGASMAMEHLRGQGCLRIGLAVGERSQARTGYRWLGGCLARRQWLDVYPGKTDSAKGVEQWVKKKRIDGVVTIHGAVYRALMSLEIRMAFLNDFDCPPGIPRLISDPRQIGTEGVRLLHHALLRGELGLPREAKMVALRGTWSD